MKTIKNILLLSFISIVIMSCDKEEEIIYVPTPYPVAEEMTATLSDLKLNGTTIEGFSSSTFEYTIGVGSQPTAGAPPPPIPNLIVTYTLTDDSYTAEQTDITSMPGSTTILVTTQDGNNNHFYTVNFVYN